MASFNRVVLVGNLVRDIELRTIPSGMAVLDNAVAVNERRKDQSGGWIEETSFVDITVWGRSAEVLSQFCRKGSQILVEGRLKQDSWEQPDGQKRSKLKVIAERVVLLGSRADGAGGQGGGYQQSGYQQQGGYQQGGYQRQGGYQQRQAPQQTSQSDGGYGGGFSDYSQDSADDIPF
ncbi:MAG: single-stranded DNA-binding protein [Thermoguttaceae bacterium]|nr:single-stranded DNA-binding protein [Thermoguttaceae bacterium]